MPVQPFVLHAPHGRFEVMKETWTGHQQGIAQTKGCVASITPLVRIKQACCSRVKQKHPSADSPIALTRHDPMMALRLTIAGTVLAK
jgi:hypothetical protein